MFSLLCPYETLIRHLLELLTLSFLSLNPALYSLLSKLYCIMHNSFISVLHSTDFSPSVMFNQLPHPVNFLFQWLCFYFWKLFLVFSNCCVAFYNFVFLAYIFRLLFCFFRYVKPAFHILFDNIWILCNTDSAVGCFRLAIPYDMLWYLTVNICSLELYL